MELLSTYGIIFAVGFVGGTASIIHQTTMKAGKFSPMIIIWAAMMALLMVYLWFRPV